MLLRCVVLIPLVPSTPFVSRPPDHVLPFAGRGPGGNQEEGFGVAAPL